jgi:hypothetical protein
MNPNQALWEKGDFTRIAASMRGRGEALVASKTAELQHELDSLAERQNQSKIKGETSIPATFLRVTVTV